MYQQLRKSVGCSRIGIETGRICHYVLPFALSDSVYGADGGCQSCGRAAVTRLGIHQDFLKEDVSSGSPSAEGVQSATAEGGS